MWSLGFIRINVMQENPVIQKQKTSWRSLVFSFVYKLLFEFFLDISPINLKLALSGSC